MLAYAVDKIYNIGRFRPFYRPRRPLGRVDHGTRRVEGSASRPGRLLSQERPGTHLQEAGWAPGPVWIGAENLAPPGFVPRTVQPVVCHYTD
jgi:hypothetical protein